MAQVWAITMVRDEVDIIVPTLQHLVTEGVDGLIVADNLSTDGTRVELEGFRSQAPIPVHVVQDDEVGYYQGRKMTALAHQAAAYGATWIVPFDVDELWCGRTKPLATVLRGCREDVVGVRSWTHIETGYDVLEGHAFQRMIYRSPQPSSLPKVCYRYQKDLAIAQGNDAIMRGGSYLQHRVVDQLEIRHFPARGPDHFYAKMLRGAKAMASAPELPPALCSHWRAYGRLIEKYRETDIRAIYFSQFFSAEPFRQGLVKDPAPWCRQT